jgi:hypothetical protein
MKINKKNRKFSVGVNNKIKINHLADIFLNKNEMITFIDKNKMSYDVVKKNWGYYATPSINGRLKNNNFKTALVSNSQNKLYIMLVEKKKIGKFKKYCKDENQKIIIWLDEETKVKKIFSKS